ncbi:MAG: ABC transporter ATP-binding protein [Pseudomonadota bacterium]
MRQIGTTLVFPLLETQSLLELTRIEKSFVGNEGKIPVLKGVSFSLAAAESVALTGESGSGKSTLLHIAGGLESADAGTVKLDDKDFSHLKEAERADLRRKKIGIVFQQFNLIPSINVAANIGFQARLNGEFDAAYIDHLAETLGLKAQLQSYPETLSGGQQQRVAIARSLAARPKIILADEPTGNLDETTAGVVLDQMLALVSETSAALLMVTHSSTVAARMQRKVHLSGGQLT